MYTMTLLQKVAVIFFIASVISPVCHSQDEALNNSEDSQPETFPISEGQSLEINCNATGSSNVGIWWAKNQTGSSFVSVGPVLRFETTNRSDAGEYLCYSNSTLHNDKTLLNKAKVYVLYRPELDPRYNFTSTIPARLGQENVTLAVHFAAEPLCQYDWRKTGPLDLHGGINYFIKNDYSAKMVISNLTMDNFDTYTLTITNSQGRLRVTFTVVPTGPPEAPRQLEVLTFTHDTASLSFVAGYDYESAQNFSVFIFNDSMTKIDEFPDEPNHYGLMSRTHTIKNLERDTRYNLTLQAFNEAGHSSYSNSVSFQTRRSVSAASGLHAGTVVGSVPLSLALTALLSLVLR